MAEIPPFEIYPYSITKLKEILLLKSKATREIVEDKLHCFYFEGYFSYLKAATIFVENRYIDRDFLDDFSKYYVRCFNDYERKCTRLHFFTLAFSEAEFDSLLKGEPCAIDETKLNDHYLGFTVIKPLPETIIGRTCLKTYDSDGDRRHYDSIIHKYDVNLFGVNLVIRSLAFQEQDHVVGACASSALWSVFYKTGFLFQHPKLSLVDITEAACSHIPLETRSIPNKGLTQTQMAHAIRSTGLEPFLVNASDQDILKQNLYAYINLGVPILMGVWLFDFSSGTPQYFGNHAIAITGYSLGYPNPIPFGSSGILLRSSRIDKIYAHDDQIGPFARMVLNQGNITINGNQHNTISTSWKWDKKPIGNVKAVSDIILIPLYNKVRIAFNTIQSLIIYFDRFIEVMRGKGFLSSGQRLEWDIRLTTINQFKNNISKLTCLTGDLKRSILLNRMPRFLWRATARCEETYVLDLLFDATDIEQGSFLIDVIGYEAKFITELLVISKDPKFDKNKPEWRILQWFARQ